ncbi:serine carboxypeptidase-like 2 [Heracleum sosnowskyi]|uniref:Serine carboxypeptidase-like 2 n=1 Tax=Heracleum sosnowskyi TaxID=360622 RepID=A0AAD8HHZ1_9APIA|nr:serine carboxypeptidase-like 2 [Heracleum sosnowskyi]
MLLCIFTDENGNASCFSGNKYYIFLDLPVGTGFSYGRTAAASGSSDSQACAQAVQFLRKWLVVHSEFLLNPFYVGGDSYAGIFIPIITQMISNGNEAGLGPSINLKGYLAGNPFAFPAQSNFRIPFCHGHALISDELYESLRKNNCGLDDQKSDPDSAECSRDLEAFKKLTDGLNKYEILENHCGEGRQPRRRRSLSDGKMAVIVGFAETPLSAVKCRDDGYQLSAYWFNDESVQKALLIRKGTIGTWSRCNTVTLDFETLIWDVRPYHANLSTKGFRSLIYSGDQDFVVPFISTQAWIKELNYSIVDEWRPWIVEGQVAGYTRSYANIMTFATVKGGGHTASCTIQTCRRLCYVGKMDIGQTSINTVYYLSIQ